MKSIGSTQGQWLGDVAIKHIGSIEGLFELSLKNGISPTGNLKPGTELIPSQIINERIVSYFKRNGINPATSDTGSAQAISRGIGYMRVNIDFIVT